MPFEKATVLLIIINGIGVPARLAPGYVADKVGQLNLLVPISACLVVVAWSWIAVHSVAGLYAFACLYGKHQPAQPFILDTHLTSCPPVHRTLSSSTPVPPPTYRSCADLGSACDWDTTWDGICSDGLRCANRTTHWRRNPASSTRTLHWCTSMVRCVDCDSFCILRRCADVQGRVEASGQGLRWSCWRKLCACRKVHI